MFNTLITTSILALNLTLPSIPPVSTPSPTLVENFQEKIKQTVQKNLATAEAELKSKLNLKTYSGYTGTITDIKENTITISSTSNQTLQLGLNKDTALVKNGTSIKIGSLAIGDNVLVIGNKTSPDILSLKRLVVYTPTFKDTSKQIVLGSVLAIIKPRSFSLQTTTGTTITIDIKTDSPTKLDNLVKGQKLLTIVKQSLKNKTFTLIQAKPL